MARSLLGGAVLAVVDDKVRVLCFATGQPQTRQVPTIWTWVNAQTNLARNAITEQDAPTRRR